MQRRLFKLFLILSLQQTAFGKRQGRRLTGDDEVIEHPHIDQCQRRLQRLRQELIGPAGLD